MTKAAIYVRVSTVAQAGEDHYSLEIQLESCKAFCAAQGWDVEERHIYHETHSAGTLDRPKLTELRDAMRRREFDKWVIYKLDRLSRNIDQQGTLFYDADRANVEIVSSTNDFQNDMQGQIVRVVAGVIAQAERTNIARRTSEGRRKALEDGKFLGRGRIPFGYSLVNYKLVPNEHSKTVRLMYDLAFEGNSSTMIASELMRQGIPTASGKDALAWTSTSVTRLLESPTYKGEVVQYKGHWETDPITKVKRYIENPPEMWIVQKDVAEPIVSAAEWETALIRMKANNQPQWKAHAKDRGTLFTSAQQVVCGHCGQSIMRIDDQRKKKLADGTIKYYEPVVTYLHNPIGATRVGCKRTSIMASTIDDAVWEAAQAIITHDRLEELLPQGDAETERLAHDVEIESIKVAEGEKKLNRARKTYEDFCEQLDAVNDADDLDKAEKAELFERVRTARRALAAAKDSLQVAKERQALHATNHVGTAELIEYMEALRPRIRNADLETRRQFMHYLGVQVHVYTTKDTYRWAAMFDQDPSKTFVAMQQDGTLVTDYSTLSHCRWIQTVSDQLRLTHLNGRLQQRMSVT